MAAASKPEALGMVNARVKHPQLLRFCSGSLCLKLPPNDFSDQRRLMFKVPFAGKDHCYSVFVCDGDDFIILL